MICENCGAENKDIAKFCGKCGVPLKAKNEMETGNPETEDSAKPDVREELNSTLETLSNNKPSSETVKVFAKDIIFGLIAGTVIAMIATGTGDTQMVMVMFWFGLGFPSGWHLANKIMPIYVFSIVAWVLRLLFAFVLGMVAFPIVMVIDIKDMVKSAKLG